MTESLTITRDRQRGGYLLEAQCLVPRPLEEVFAFFSNARNLQRITPAWIDFDVVTPGEILMHVGALIDYRLKIRGLPLKWRTKITAWEPQTRFVDEMLRGPYRWWRHEHTFQETDAGTQVVDRVHYGVPGGALVHGLFVGRDVRAIFVHRQQALREIFAAREPLAV